MSSYEIAVIDDEMSVRDVVVRMIERFGPYRVTPFKSGAEFIDIGVDNIARSFNGIVSDYNCNYVGDPINDNLLKVYAKATQSGLFLPIWILSGNTVPQADLNAINATYLSKPASMAVLKAALQSKLP